MTNLEEITKFLEDTKAIREFDLESSLMESTGAKKIREKTIYTEMSLLMKKYSNLGSPEKEYLESLKNFYRFNKFDYSEIEKGKTPLDTPLSMLFLNYDSPRAINCLKTGDIEYLGELVQYNEKDLFKNLRNFGKKSLSEVKEVVSKAGYTLGMDINYVRPEKRI